MTKFITFFNHKGGVGKTTLSYNVAWGLANAGKKVLMIDADPQCNLTEITINLEDEYEHDCVIQGSSFDAEFSMNNNVYNYFSPFVQPVPNQELPKIETYKKTENLFLLPGSIRFAELEETIALSIAGINAFSHVPTSVYDALNKISDGMDYVIIDLSPAISATNQLMLMLSDYFIIPVNPSIFSQQALSNLGEIFRSWNRNLSNFEVFAKRLKGLPKLLGIVCQNYRPYSRSNEKDTKSAKRFENRMTELNKCATELASDLNGFGMALKPEEFTKTFVDLSPYRIANLPDYNQLSQISETEKVPVIGLDPEILRRNEIFTPQYRDKVEGFKKECENIIEGLKRL